MKPASDPLLRAAQALDDMDDTAASILDAARQVFGAHGLRRSTMEDVARQAALGRATVYRRFPSKDALVQTVLLAELRDYLAALDDAIADTDGFDNQMVEGFVATLRYVREHSMLTPVIELDGDWGAAYFTVMAGPVIATARAYLAEKIRQAQAAGHAAGVDPEPVAELIVRLCHSLMLTPQGVIPYDDDELARTFAERYLVPIITGRGPAQ